MVVPRKYLGVTLILLLTALLLCSTSGYGVSSSAAALTRSRNLDEINGFETNNITQGETPDEDVDVPEHGYEGGEDGEGHSEPGHAVLFPAFALTLGVVAFFLLARLYVLRFICHQNCIVFFFFSYAVKN